VWTGKPLFYLGSERLAGVRQTVVAPGDDHAWMAVPRELRQAILDFVELSREVGAFCSFSATVYPHSTNSPQVGHMHTV